LKLLNSLKILAVGLLTAGAFLATTGVAEAHHRDFTFLRDWNLPFAGENEIEYRLSHNNRMDEFVHEVEFEHGITNHFAIEPGLEWHEQEDEKLHLDGFDVELRFNFGESAFNKVLFALNAEYEHPFDEEEADHGELKFIASYYTPDGQDFSLNLNLGQELEKDKEKEGEIMFGYVRPLQKLETSAHHGYKIGLRGGFEARYDFQEHFFNIGPTVAFEADEHFNIIAHYFFAGNHRHENTDGFRVIAEWEF
jgi:hypothetical protein